jgi:hypothetical protein
MEVSMGRPAGWMKELTGRSPMKSPGKPSLRRDVERLFWREVAKGLSSEDAAAAVGVSPAAGTRGFRERGGMPTFLINPVAGRYLSFEERGVMALLLAVLGRRAINSAVANERLHDYVQERLSGGDLPGAVRAEPRRAQA